MKIKDNNGLTEQEFLKQYNPGDYPRPSVAADIAIFTVGEIEGKSHRRLSDKELRILLIERGGHPYLGCWALPGGFVKPTETVLAAAQRELKEETGLAHGYLEQLFTFSDPGRDPRTWVMSCTHMALVDSHKIQLKAGDDASDARWFKVSWEQLDDDNKQEHANGKRPSGSKKYRLELSADIQTLSAVVECQDEHGNAEFTILENNGLAFDHARIIAYAMQRLQNKVEYTDLVFNLMPDKFTLTELQQVYEIILGRPLLKAAFRRKIKDLVQETGEYTGNAGHRPSQLFCRCQNKPV